MNSSSLSSRDNYSSLSNSSAKTSPLKKTLEPLENDLASGAATDVCSVAADIVSYSSKNSDSTSGTANASDDFNTFLKSFQIALPDGNTSNAQSFVSLLQEAPTAQQPSQPPAAGTYSATGNFTSKTASSTASSALA